MIWRKTASLVIVLMSFWVSGCQEQQAPTITKKTLHERVIDTGTLRCAYVVYPPAVIKDPNTGKLSGVFVDAVEQAAKNLDLKVDWAEEVGWGTMIEGLLTQRYDLVVCQIWPSAARAKKVDFSTPLYYSAVGVFVRQGEQRFTGNLPAINSADVKIATVDGEMSDIIATRQFPLARKVSLPQLSDLSQLMLNVADGKADVTFLDLPAALRYVKNNPGKVQNIAVGHPIRVFPSCVMFGKGEVGFESMLNRAIEELINSGFVDQLIAKYEEIPGSVYPVAYPYRSPE